MAETQIAQAVQLLDVMLEHFADDRHWTRGRYDDGNGGHCLVGALLHLSRKHGLPRAPAIALLQDAMPRLMRPVCRRRWSPRALGSGSRRSTYGASRRARMGGAVPSRMAADGRGGLARRARRFCGGW